MLSEYEQNIKIAIKNGVCEKCLKRIVQPEDWGDYDDACEWACRCGGC